MSKLIDQANETLDLIKDNEHKLDELRGLV